MIETLLSKDVVPARAERQPRISEAQLADLYGGAVYKFCRRLTFSESDADDLYQDTFLNVFTQMHKLEKIESPQSFLFSTAAYLWKSKRRKYARRHRLAPETNLDEATNAEIASASIEDDLLAREERDAVRSLVEALPEKLKIPIVLRYTNELPIAEIASILKIPRGTVMSRLHKARKIIKKGLVSKYGYRIEN
jgi:RNA polymerase sigma-70 factor (ECF subfamily)